LPPSSSVPQTRKHYIPILKNSQRLSRDKSDFIFNYLKRCFSGSEKRDYFDKMRQKTTGGKARRFGVVFMFFRLFRPEENEQNRAGYFE